MDLASTIEKLRSNPKGVRFVELVRVCAAISENPINEVQATGFTALRGEVTPG